MGTKGFASNNHVIIINNHINGNGGYGIRINEAHQGVISNNDVIGNTSGTWSIVGGSIEIGHNKT